MKLTSLLKVLALLGWTSACLATATVALARPLAAPPSVTDFNPKSTTAGVAVQIVIVGTNFDGTSTVAVHGVPFAVNSFEPTVITATGTVLEAGSAFTVAVTNAPDSSTLGGFTVSPAAADVITITPSSASNVLAGSNTTTFSAVATDQYGNSLPASAINWNSTNTSLGTVSPASGGSTTLTAGGTAGTHSGLVRASSGAKQKTADVTIVPGPAATLIITPTSDSIGAGQTRNFVATVSDQFGNIRAGEGPNWTASGGSFAPTSGTSTVFSPTNAAGTYAISAIFGALPQKNATITVVAGSAALLTIAPATSSMSAGGTIAFTAYVSDSVGNPVTTGSVAWNKLSGVGSVTSSGARTANFTSAAVGSAIVSATLGTLGGNTASVTVDAGAATQMTIVASAASMTAGGTIAFTAYVSDSVGNPVTTGSVAWNKLSGVGSITSSGTRTANFTSNASGSATISATLGTVGGNTASVTVNAGPVSQMSIAPVNSSMTAGGTRAFTAWVSDTFGNPVSTGTVSWSKLSGVGSVTSSGARTANFTSAAVGSAIVSATLGTLGGNTASVTVDAGAATQMTIVASAASMTAGGTIAFTAYVSDSVGNPVTTGSVAWNKLSGVGSITSSGTRTANFTSNASGSATISATLGTVGGNTASVTVNAGPMSQMSIAPVNSSMTAGGTRAFTAWVSDTFGNPVSTGTVSWSKLSGVGSVTSSGARTANFTSAAVGSAIVSATLGTLGGNTASVTVDAGAATQMTIVASAASMTAGGTIAFTAYVSDSVGNPVTTGSVAWNKLSGVGSITSSGTRTANFTSNASGSATISATLGTVGGNTASVTVNAGAVSQISIAPVNSSMTAGGTRAFTAWVSDTFGNPVSTGTVSWSKLSGVGSVTSSGARTANFTSNASGSATISATLGTLGGNTASVTVNAGPASQMSIAPVNSSMTAGGSVAFTAYVSDTFGNPVSTGTVAWNKLSGVGSVTSSGARTANFTSATVGSATISATLGTVGGNTASVTVNAGPVSQISIAPVNSSMTAGGSVAFTAYVSDTFGNPVSTGTVSWNKLSGVGSVTSSGARTANFTSNASGSVTISATLGTLGGNTASVTVNAGPASQMSIAPVNSSMTAGGSVAFTAYVSDTFGNPIATSSVTWSKLSGVGSITSSGARTANFTSNASGSATISATFGTVGGNTASITVNPGNVTQIDLTPAFTTLAVNDTQGFSATPKDVFGNTVNTPLSWSTSDTTKGTVSPATGASTVFTAKTTAGIFTNLLRVSAGGITRTATITITPGAPNYITITPSSASITVSDTRQFTAAVYDAFGNAIPNSTLIWSVSSAQVGTLTTIDADTIRLNAGTVAGAYPDGLRVTSSGITKTAAITLNPGALAKVTLDPTSETFKPNETKTFTAQGRDQFDNPISGLSYSWSLSSGAPGTLSSSGQFADYTAGTLAGVYTNIVRASSGGFTGRATVVVNPDDIASIVISPSSATLTPNATQTFSARAYDPFGNEITSFGVNWSTTNNSIGSVVSSGPTTAIIRAGTVAGVYPASVRAATSGVTGTASLTVIAGSLSRIILQPDNVFMGGNNTQNFTALGVDAWDNPVPGFSAIWSATPGVGSFDSTSATSAVFRSTTTPGNYANAVKAQSGGVSAFANVIVVQGTVAAISITPSSASIGINQTQLFTATINDAFGNPFPQLSVLWQFSPSNIGTIVSSGPLTVLVKMNTLAGTFTDGLQAFNGSIKGVATIAVPSDPPADLQMSANPTTLTTDGVNVATIVVSVTDQYGNSVGAGQSVALTIDQCDGTCSLGTTIANTGPDGRIVTTLRSDYRSPMGTTSVIKLSASLGTSVVRTVNVAGQFVPFRSSLAMFMRDYPINNRTSCLALVLNPPDSAKQAPDSAFNIYRFKATAAAHTVSVSNYAATGQLLLYRIVSDKCATNGSMTVVYLGQASITSGTLYQKTFTGLTLGQNYLLAVNTTASFSSQVYTLSVTP